MSQDIISEILGTPIEQELGEPNTDSEISPDYTIDFLYNTFLKPQLKKEDPDQDTWQSPKRDILKVIEDRMKLLLSSNLESEERQTIISTHRDIYLSILSQLEELYEFSSEEATNCAPENWQTESLIQNVTALYELFIIHKDETVVTFLTEYIKQNLEEIIADIKDSIPQGRIKSLMKFLSTMMKEAGDENIAMLYYNLTEICSKILSTEIDAGSFFEILNYADEGELNLTLASELIPASNVDFYSNLVSFYASKPSFIAVLSSRVRGLLADYLSKRKKEEEKD